MENEKRQPSRESVAEEEEEMERFFALVRNFKEMRDQRRKELIISDEEEFPAERKRKTRETVQNQSTWIPKFEREDFDEEFQLRGPALVLPKPCKEDAAAAAMKEKKKVKNGDDNCLDLNLGL